MGVGCTNSGIDRSGLYLQSYLSMAVTGARFIYEERTNQSQTVSVKNGAVTYFCKCTSGNELMIFLSEATGMRFMKRYILITIIDLVFQPYLSSRKLRFAVYQRNVPRVDSVLNCVR